MTRRKRSRPKKFPQPPQPGEPSKELQRKGKDWFVQGVVIVLLGLFLQLAVYEWGSAVANWAGVEVLTAQFVMGAVICVGYLLGFVIWRSLQTTRHFHPLLGVLLFGLGGILATYGRSWAEGRPRSLNQDVHMALGEVLKLKHHERHLTEKDYSLESVEFNICCDGLTAVLEQVGTVDMTRPEGSDLPLGAPFMWSCASDSNIFSEKTALQRTSFEVLGDNGSFRPLSLSVEAALQSVVTLFVFEVVGFPDWSLSNGDRRKVTFRSRICWPGAVWRPEDLILLDLGDWPNQTLSQVTVRFLSTARAEVDVFAVKESDSRSSSRPALKKLDPVEVGSSDPSFEEELRHVSDAMIPDGLTTGTVLRFSPEKGSTAYVLRVRTEDRRG